MTAFEVATLVFASFGVGAVVGGAVAVGVAAITRVAAPEGE